MSLVTGFEINNIKINHESLPFIIAEAGVNHNGRLDLALQLIDVAAEAGADAVKFQTFRAEQVVTSAGTMAEYQKRNLQKETTQLAMLKELELKEHWYPEIIKRAKEKGIIWLSTPHGGKDSVDLLESYKMPAFKIGSGELTHLPLLEYTAKFGKPMLISTGMSNFEEVKEAVEIIKQTGNNKILVFQCTTDYPLAPEFVHLRTLLTFKDKLDVLVGYSDHTVGYHASAVAVALGASMIEKHLTLDRNMLGPDHVASIDPKEFKEFVKMIKGTPRNLERAIQMLHLTSQELEVLMGSPEKIPQIPEIQYRTIARKSIVSSRPIKKNEKLTNENLTIKRPGYGMPPKYLTQIIGKSAKKDIPQDVLLEEEMINN